jgi:hypothetical protein
MTARPSPSLDAYELDDGGIIDFSVSPPKPRDAAYLPCPICNGVEGCDHSVSERRRAWLAHIRVIDSPQRAAAKKVARELGEKLMGRSP